METKIKLLYMVIDLLLPLTLGYYCRKRQWLSEAFCDNVIEYNIIFFCTFLAGLSFWALPLNLGLLSLPVFGVLLSFIPGLAGYLVAKFKYEDGPDKVSYLASAMLSNIGALCGLCTYVVFGEPGFAYIQIIAIFQNLVFFLFCFPMSNYYNHLLRKQQGNTESFNIAVLFFNRNQLPVIGVAAGMLLCANGIERPAVFGDIFNALIHISAWTAFFPVGYSIQFSEMQQYYRDTLSLLPVKFIITPLAGWLIASQLFTDPVVLGTVIIAASAPAGINAVVLSRLLNFNIHLASAAFFLTTIFFLAVIYPLLFVYLH